MIWGSYVGQIYKELSDRPCNVRYYLKNDEYLGSIVQIKKMLPVVWFIPVEKREVYIATLVGM